MNIGQLINLGIYDDYEKIVVIASNIGDKYRIVYKGYLCEIYDKYKKLTINNVSALSNRNKSTYYIKSTDGFTGIYVVEDIDDINEIDLNDEKSRIADIANKLRRTDYTRWDYELCRELCKLAGLEDEFDAVDTGDIDDVQSVVYDAADILGVVV
jgi:uncharacterized protein YabN with tetrapyrrole methylase and pyrophosphatase domain